MNKFERKILRSPDKPIQVKITLKTFDGKRKTRIIDEVKLNFLQDEFKKSGGDLFALLLSNDVSYESKLIEL